MAASSPAAVTLPGPGVAHHHLGTTASPRAGGVNFFVTDLGGDGAEAGGGSFMSSKSSSSHVARGAAADPDALHVLTRRVRGPLGRHRGKAVQVEHIRLTLG